LQQDVILKKKKKKRPALCMEALKYLIQAEKMALILHEQKRIACRDFFSIGKARSKEG